jgi:tRNA pseudouridine32 synthase/23S rRNA pseudouridine746 synthase
MQEDKCFIQFKQNTDHYDLPHNFTFPFQYQPHPIALQAAKELQEYITHQSTWEHQFWQPSEIQSKPIGKMFGVLVVKNSQNQIGYLTAFSGILSNRTLLEKFVPPIYDRKADQSEFIRIEKETSAINTKIKQLENSSELNHLKDQLAQNKSTSQQILSEEKKKLKQAKKRRDAQRLQYKDQLDAEEYESLLNSLRNESMNLDYEYKKLSKSWKAVLLENESGIAEIEKEIDHLKNKRKLQSAKLQDALFTEYRILNFKGDSQGVLDIFEHWSNIKPPAGAGDCAAPKLLQYAFKNEYHPIALAEFWWGKSPQLEVRKHQLFYPACKSKCEPILTHMLSGMEVDKNPIDQISTTALKIEKIFEDDDIIIINKPANLLSISGKKIKDSVFTRLRAEYPDATGPMLAHRLDMSTSGLMIISKSLDTHRILQRQFTNRTVQKKYVAILEGYPDKNTGTIDLPLRVDLDHRPHQVVCNLHGKTATTKWTVIEKKNNQTRIHFFPITGRTHQLRVHASHPKGLNCPILGDDLYGTPNDRLHLHAESISFLHPTSGKEVSFQKSPDF